VGTPASFILTNNTGAATTLVTNGGTPQATQINTAFAAPLAAKVTDGGNNPVSGVVVTFAAPGSGASGSFAGGINTATTNAAGIATSGIFTANATVGVYTVTATAGALGPINFALTNMVGAASAIATVSGTPQSATISTSFAAPLVAKVTDAGNNPVSGVVVTFAAPGSGASGSFAGGVNTATTNAAGIATSAIFTANASAGAYTVTAAAAGVGTPASFALTNTAGLAALVTATGGTPQTATISTAFALALQAKVTDAGNNPLSGVVVTFTAPGSGASGSFTGGINTATTNAAGIATSAVFTANATAGAYTILALSGSATPATFTLTNQVGAAASITATGGTPQNTGVNTTFASPL
jgi:hypothetical protein